MPGQKFFAEYFAQASQDTGYDVLDPVVVMRTFQEAMAHALSRPEALIEHCRSEYLDAFARIAPEGAEVAASLVLQAGERAADGRARARGAGARPGDVRRPKRGPLR